MLQYTSVNNAENKYIAQVCSVRGSPCSTTHSAIRWLLCFHRKKTTTILNSTFINMSTTLYSILVAQPVWYEWEEKSKIEANAHVSLKHCTYKKNYVLLKTIYTRITTNTRNLTIKLLAHSHIQKSFYGLLLLMSVLLLLLLLRRRMKTELPCCLFRWFV